MQRNSPSSTSRRRGFGKWRSRLQAKADQADPDKNPMATEKMYAPDWMTLAACYFRMGRRAEAMKDLRAADRTNYLANLVAKRDRLEAIPPDARSNADRINLGACCIRLGRYNDAVQVLGAADQRDFMVLANLAAAYDGMKELDRAVGYEEQALDAWPSSQPGWDAQQLYWYHRAETYYLKLLRLRLRESLANPSVKSWDRMDALFDRPRSAGGPYEPNMPPWRLWGDLPPDAAKIVAQLLVWSPNDDRLYWQAGRIVQQPTATFATPTGSLTSWYTSGTTARCANCSNTAPFSRRPCPSRRPSTTPFRTRRASRSLSWACTRCPPG